MWRSNPFVYYVASMTEPFVRFSRNSVLMLLKMVLIKNWFTECNVIPRRANEFTRICLLSTFLG